MNSSTCLQAGHLAPSCGRIRGSCSGDLSGGPSRQPQGCRREIFGELALSLLDVAEAVGVGGYPEPAGEDRIMDHVGERVGIDLGYAGCVAFLLEVVRAGGGVG